MKSTLVVFFAVCLIACNSETKNAESTTTTDSTASSSAGVKSDEWIPVDSTTARRTMMEVGTPGKEQALLAKSDGKWKAEILMWEKAGGEPVKSTGTLSNKMIMGGRYQETTFKGDMMGMPFEGVSKTGYDNARKVWVSSWVDNMSTGIMNMDGTYDEANKTWTFTGEMLCPANGKMCEMKQVLRRVDDKTEIMEMWGPDMQTGKPFKGMEMKMTKG